MEAQNLGIKGFSFYNWAQTFTCSPDLYFAPKGTNELRQILAFARNQQKKVRFVGCGHSPSDLVCTDDYMISLQNMNKIIEVDQMNCVIRVEGGITVKELNSALPEHNLALSCLGSVSDVTLVGAFSTGTHGSGITFGNMAAYVLDVDLLQSDGNLIHCSPTEHHEVFLAALCGIGALGAVVSLRFQCEPLFKLEKTTYPATLKDVIENLDIHLRASEHFHFHWYPHTENVLVIHLQRTQKPCTKYSQLQRLSNWFWYRAFGFYTLEFLYWVGLYVPSFVATVNRLVFYCLCSKRQQKVGLSQDMFNMDCRFKQYVTEWSVDVKETGAVLFELKNWLENNPEVFAHVAVEVRFSKSDDIYISPCYGRDTCFVNIVQYRPYNQTVPIEKYWNAFESIMWNHKGRPHWAKAHMLTSKELSLVYPQWKNWCQIRKKVDPTDMFVNPYLQRILN